VGHKIGLSQNLPKNTAETFVKKRLNKSVVESDLRFTTYLLNEGIKQNNDNNKRKHNKSSNRLNAKQRKLLFNIDKDHIKYQTFDALNHLWHNYIDSVINEIKSKSDQVKLIRADFHASYFIVCAAKNPSLVGIKGYVVQETKNIFKIVNEENRLLSEFY